MSRLFMLILTIGVGTGAGIGVIAALTMGHYSTAGIVVGAAIGAVVGVIASWIVTRRLVAL